MRRSLGFISLLTAFVLTLQLVACTGKDGSASVDSFTVGYGDCEIGFDLDEQTLFVAGYKSGYQATGALDAPKVKAVFLEAGQSVLLLSVDCIALASGTVAKIRAALSDFSRDTDCKEIHIISTHDHAGADTLGLWGRAGIDGKNDRYMESLLSAAVSASYSAYNDRRSGDILYGYADCSELLEDTRKPEVFDSKIHSLRFAPDDGSPGIMMLNLASHSESLGGNNSLISADFPEYIARSIAERTGERTVYFPGAIGGLIRTKFLTDDSIENCKKTGELIASAVLGIDNEVKLEPRLETVSESFEVECENPLFIGMKFLGVLENDLYVVGNRAVVRTSLSLITIGEYRILLLPGEIFPELVYGSAPDFQPTHPERNDPTPLCELLGDRLLIFGLADDEIGYIIPPSDFELDPDNPYLITPEKDHNGENHYEETNSVGIKAAEAVASAVRRLLKKIS